MSSAVSHELPGDWCAQGAESLSTLLRWHAMRTPHAPALVSFDGAVIDYGELTDTVASLAQRLCTAGIGEADRVVTVLPDSVDSALLLLAVLCTSACVPLNPGYAEPEIRAVLEAVGATVVITGAAARGAAAAAALDITVLRFTGRYDGYELIGQAVRGAGSPGPLPAGTLLLRTSGTTAAGKLVPVGWRAMSAGAAASCRAYALGANDRRLNVMPLFHIQAIVGSLLCSLWCGSSVAIASPFSPPAIPGLLAERDVTWFSATPTMHRQILDAAPPVWRPPSTLRFVRVGSAALPQSLRARLEDFYQVPVVESYGMTEAHQIASTPLPPQPPAAGLVPTGSRIAIVDEAGSPVTRPGVFGEIAVAGDNVIDGYLWPPEENHKAFTGGWFKTGDMGELLADGSLRITGRLKELIDRGGEKISPTEVEQVLLDHPAVADVAVFAIPDPVWTEQVGAAVVITPGHRQDPAELREFARARLAAFKVPSLFIFPDELPLTGTGKVSRRLLAELTATPDGARERAAPQPGGATARNSTEAALIGIWAHALRTSAVGVDDDFFTLGGQSLEAVALLTMVHEVFGVRIEPIALFDEVTTVALMAELIARQRAGAPESHRAAEVPG
jgi:acyl-CoA synthetase (AMP-forming)/AMP-acid ligase II/acyl carrier protein